MSILTTSTARSTKQGKFPPVARVAHTPIPTIATHALPVHADPNNYTPLKNGGWLTKTAASVAQNGMIFDQRTYSKDDPPVRVDFTTYFNGHFKSKSGAGDWVTPFYIPFDWIDLTGQPTKVHASRGSAAYHASREPHEFTYNSYIINSGSSFQEWLVTFPEEYEQIIISEITNGEVRSATWGDLMPVGVYERTSDKLWLGGNAGAVTIRYLPQKKQYTQDYGGVSVGMDTDLVGSYRRVGEITYLSGYVETYEITYEVTGDPVTNFTDIELIPGGWPVTQPIYKEHWEDIQAFYTPTDTIRAAAVQSRIDAAPAKPTSATQPYEFSFNDQSNPPADVVMAQTIIATGKSAGDTGINLYESQVSSNPIAAALAELNSYQNIVKTWRDLADTTGNANLKAVAEKNATFTSIFAEESRLAHNGVIDFAEPDANWQTYQVYMAYFDKQTPNEVVDIKTWDEVL